MSAGAKAPFVFMLGCSVLKVAYISSQKIHPEVSSGLGRHNEKHCLLKRRNIYIFFLLGVPFRRDAYWFVYWLDIVLSYRQTILPRKSCKNKNKKLTKSFVVINCMVSPVYFSP